MQTSLLVPYSVARVAENKALGDRFIVATPLERQAFLDGDIGVNDQEFVIEGGGLESAFSDRVVVGTPIQAEWLPLNSNRMTAPDVRVGERVLLYRYAQTDQYYWRCLGLDDHLRVLETVVLAINASPSLDDHELRIDNCYFLEISSHTKQITLQTSKANGEPFGYLFQFNLADGNVALQDDAGNHVIVDSTNTVLELKNAANTRVRLDKQTIKIHADQTIDVNAGQRITLKCGASALTLTPNGTTLRTPQFSGVKS